MYASICNWDDLRVFLAVVREGTLGRAAHTLGVDQSTVYRRCGELSERLGTRLFEKRGRRYVLTAAGEELATYAGRVEDELLAVEREIAGRDTQLVGTVRVTTSDTIAHGLLPSHLAEFRCVYPGVRVELAIDDRFYMLGRGEADVAVRAGPRPTELDVIPREVGRAHGAAYASERYLEKAGHPKRLRDLASHSLVSLDDRLAHIPFARRTRELAPASAVVFRSTSLTSVAAAVEAGVGIGLLPAFLMEGRSGVTRLFAPDPELDSPIWIIIHRALRQTARVRALVDFLEERLRRELSSAVRRPARRSPTRTSRAG